MPMSVEKRRYTYARLSGNVLAPDAGDREGHPHPGERPAGLRGAVPPGKRPGPADPPGAKPA